MRRHDYPACSTPLSRQYRTEYAPYALPLTLIYHVLAFLRRSALVAYMERLERILSELAHLNLDGQILDKQDCVSKLGGSCDVFRAWSTKHMKKVAVKQIREFMGENMLFAKVRLVTCKLIKDMPRAR